MMRSVCLLNRSKCRHKSSGCEVVWFQGRVVCVCLCQDVQQLCVYCEAGATGASNDVIPCNTRVITVIIIPKHRQGSIVSLAL